MPAAIEVSHVSKRYHRRSGNKPRTLKEVVVSGFRGLKTEAFWALHDVSFAVESGRTLGVVGSNGAGKSTALRLVADVERPDQGEITVNGRVGAILEIGAGFHPELTGRENAVLATIIAGFSRRDALARLPEIIAFAELESFVDSALRTYSTGMHARLAFSIAASIEPEILLIDEALSVGDIGFRTRALDRIREFQRAGVTTVVVSHDPTVIRDLCDEAAWLDDGTVVAHGPATQVMARYVSANAERASEMTPMDVPDAVTPDGTILRVHENRLGSQEGAITEVRIFNGWGQPSAVITTGSEVAVDVAFTPPPQVREVHVGVTLRRADDVVCLDVSTLDRPATGAGHVRLTIERLDAAAGQYVVDVGLYSADWTRTYDYHYGAYQVTIVGQPGGSGILAPPLHWTRQEPVAVRPESEQRKHEGEVTPWPRR